MQIILLVVAFLAPLVLCQDAADLPVDTLDASYLSSLRVEYRKLTKIHQCASVWKAVDERLRKEVKLKYRKYPENTEDLIDLVDLGLFQRIGEMLKKKTQSTQLTGFMDECSSLIERYRQIQGHQTTAERVEPSKSDDSIKPSLREKLGHIQAEKAARDEEYKRQSASLDEKMKAMNRDSSSEGMQFSAIRKKVALLLDELKEKENKLNTCEANLADSARRVDNLELDVAAKSKFIGYQKTDMASRDREVKILREKEARFDEQEQIIIDLRNKLELNKGQLLELEQRASERLASELSNQASQFKSELEAKKKEIEKLTSGVTNIAVVREEELRREITARDLQVRRLQNDLNARTDEVLRLKLDIRGQEEQFKLDLASKSEQISKLRSELIDKSNQATHYKDALSQCANSLTETKQELVNMDLKEAKCADEKRQLEALLADKREQNEKLMSGEIERSWRANELTEALKLSENNLNSCKIELGQAKNRIKKLLADVESERNNCRVNNNPNAIPVHHYHSRPQVSYEYEDGNNYYPTYVQPHGDASQRLSSFYQNFINPL